MKWVIKRFKELVWYIPAIFLFIGFITSIVVILIFIPAGGDSVMTQTTTPIIEQVNNTERGLYLGKYGRVGVACTLSDGSTFQQDFRVDSKGRMYNDADDLIVIDADCAYRYYRKETREEDA